MSSNTTSRGSTSSARAKVSPDPRGSLNHPVAAIEGRITYHPTGGPLATLIQAIGTNLTGAPQRDPAPAETSSAPIITATHHRIRGLVIPIHLLGAHKVNDSVIVQAPLNRHPWLKRAHKSSSHRAPDPTPRITIPRNRTPHKTGCIRPVAASANRQRDCTVPRRSQAR